MKHCYVWSVVLLSEYFEELSGRELDGALRFLGMTLHFCCILVQRTSMVQGQG